MGHLSISRLKENRPSASTAGNSPPSSGVKKTCPWSWYMLKVWPRRKNLASLILSLKLFLHRRRTLPFLPGVLAEMSVQMTYSDYVQAEKPQMICITKPLVKCTGGRGSCRAHPHKTTGSAGASPSRTKLFKQP